MAQQFQQMNAMAPMAMNMGQQFLSGQTEMLKQKADQYIPTTKLRYLFAVDTSYVFQKLKIITLPWLHGDWMLKYQTDVNTPIAPRYAKYFFVESFVGTLNFLSEMMSMLTICIFRQWPSLPTFYWLD